MFRSDDSGNSFRQVGVLPEGTFNQLALDLADTDDLWAGTTSGIARSSDGGKSWNLVALNGLAVGGIGQSKSQPLRMYAGVPGAGMFRSDDGGDHWSARTVGYPQRGTVDILVDPTNPDVVLAAVSPPGAVLRSQDGGTTWETVLSSTTAFWSMTRCPADPRVIYASGGSGVSRSRDGGLTWQTVFSDSSTYVAANPINCDDFYVLVWTVGPRRTMDGGATFSAPLTSGLDIVPQGGGPANLAVDPRDVTRVLAATHAGAFLSTTAGASWSQIPGPRDLRLMLGSTPLDPERLWLASWGAGVWTRASSQVPWTRIPRDQLPMDTAMMVVADPLLAGRVFVGFPGPMYMSSDDGQSFFNSGLVGNSQHVAFDPTSRDVLYVANQTLGITRSTDGGKTWVERNGALQPWPTPNDTYIDMRRVAVDPNAPQTLYAASNGRGLFKTTDAGESWQNVLSPDAVVTCLLVLPSTPTKVYACANGLRLSTDGGASWTDVTPGLPSLTLTGIVHDAVTDTLYVTTSHGVFQRRGSERFRLLDNACFNTATDTPVIMHEGSRRFLAVAARGSVFRYPL